MNELYLQEIYQKLSIHSIKISQENGQTRLNIRVPILRKEANRPFSFSQCTKHQKIEVWSYIWKNSPYFEVKSLALYNYQSLTLDHQQFSVIITWIDQITCWEHSDDLSKIYAQIVEENPLWILPHLKEWNLSANPWKRRQSLVSLLEYASKRKKVLTFDELISFVSPLLKDSEYYVQKGLGWTLREIYNLYPQETLIFLEDNLQNLSSIAYSSSTEKLSPSTKKSFNLQRKKIRTKKG
ncbi:DNA alkylation repair protein [bacterium]|nr:DNA alkylation repair protein [bacterium]